MFDWPGLWNEKGFPFLEILLKKKINKDIEMS
jgi:hypothetical protein